MSIRRSASGIVTTAVTTVAVLALAVGVATHGAMQPTHKAFKDQTRSRLQVLEATTAEQGRLIAGLERRIVALEATPEPTVSPSPEPTMAPIAISAIVVEEVGEDFAIVSWSVDPPAQGWVEYGETEAYGSETRRETRLLGFHRQRVSGLQPDTTYHFRVWAFVPDQSLMASADVSA